MRKKRIVARKNAKPEIVGRWDAPQPTPPTDSAPSQRRSPPKRRNATPLDGHPGKKQHRQPAKALSVTKFRAKFQAAAARDDYGLSDQKGPSPAAIWKELQAQREHDDPRGNARLAQMLSTSPRATRSGDDERHLPNVASDGLVPRQGLPAIDKRELVLAIVELVNLTYESTVGIGPGGLFNFKYEVALRLIDTGRRLRANRTEAARVAYRQRLLDHVANVYQGTTDEWYAQIPTNVVLVRGVLTTHQKALMSEQRDALRILFKHAKFRMPLSRAARTGADIRREGGPIRAAAKLLDDLDQLSASGLIKERKRVSPLFEHRAMEQPFPIGSGSEATASRFARFAYALYRAAADPTTPTESTLVRFKDAPDSREGLPGLLKATRFGRPFPISQKRGDLPVAGWESFDIPDKPPFRANPRAKANRPPQGEQA